MANPDDWPPAKRKQVAAQVANDPDGFMAAMVRYDVELNPLERMMQMEGFERCELCEIWRARQAMKAERIGDENKYTCSGCAEEGVEA